MKKWVLYTMVLAMGLFVLSACSEDSGNSSSDSGDSDEPDYVIGATQITAHPSLDAAFDGFKAAIKDAGLNVEYDYQDAQNDQNNVKVISEGFVGDGVDLIFANSTPSAAGALQATKAKQEIPILFTSVSDPVEAGLVEAMDKPGKNITGVVDLHPDAIKKTVEFIEKYFPGAVIGTIYNSGEANSVAQLEQIKEALEGTDLTIKERSVANGSEVAQAATSLVSDVDVFYVFTDNTVVEALGAVINVANEQKIPLIVGEPDSVKKGGFATYGIDYYTIGYRTGEMAVSILKDGKTTEDIPVEYPPEIQLYINKTAVEKQDIEWHDEWDEDAEILTTETE